MTDQHVYFTIKKIRDLIPKDWMQREFDIKADGHIRATYVIPRWNTGAGHEIFVTKTFEADNYESFEQLVSMEIAK